MHDLLFAKQDEWVSLSVEQFEEWVTNEAESLDLDMEQFAADLNSQEMLDMAQQAWDDAVAAGIPGTPFLLVNGTIYPSSLPMDYTNIEAIIKLVILEKRQFTTCPPVTIDKAKEYIATLHTTKGDIKIELFAQQAPLAVNSFIFLAENGWFDNVMFHRVIPGFVAQSGDPSGSGFGGPGYAFDNEISPDLKFDKPGVVGMANAGPGSNGSQFFITYGPTTNLDGGYTIFGQVIEGMEVAEALIPRDPSQSGAALPEGDFIESITIEEN
jgi:cyclophilin family peptidyl-prolyl cis-trans isomerase